MENEDTSTNDPVPWVHYFAIVLHVLQLQKGELKDMDNQDRERIEGFLRANYPF